MLRQECTPADTTGLAAQARAAYEQKRTRDCLALLARLAAVDPGNADTEALLSAIRIDLQRDLNDARALLEQAGTDDEQRTLAKAAQLILLKIIGIDPGHAEAKSLLRALGNDLRHDPDLSKAAAIALEQQVASAVAHVRLELMARWDEERAQLLAQRSLALQTLADRDREHQLAVGVVECMRAQLSDERERLERLVRDLTRERDEARRHASQKPGRVATHGKTRV